MKINNAKKVVSIIAGAVTAISVVSVPSVSSGMRHARISNSRSGIICFGLLAIILTLLIASGIVSFIAVNYSETGDAE